MTSWNIDSTELYKRYRTDLINELSNDDNNPTDADEDNITACAEDAVGYVKAYINKKDDLPNGTEFSWAITTTMYFLHLRNGDVPDAWQRRMDMVNTAMQRSVEAERMSAGRDVPTANSNSATRFNIDNPDEDDYQSFPADWGGDG